MSEHAPGWTVLFGSIRCITSEKYSVKFRTGDLIPFYWSLIRNVYEQLAVGHFVKLW